MNVVQLLFTLLPGRHSPAEALAGLGLRVAKSGHFPFLCFLLSPGDGPARFIAGGGTSLPSRRALRARPCTTLNTTPLTAEETRPGRNSKDTGFYLPDCSSSLQNILSSNYANPHVALDI